LVTTRQWLVLNSYQAKKAGRWFEQVQKIGEEKTVPAGVERVKLLPLEHAAVVLGNIKQLTPARYKVVAYLVGRAPDRVQLSTLSLHTSDDADRYLREMSQADSDWRNVIHLPGGRKGLGYRIF
jgi:hypothetical protein